MNIKSIEQQLIMKADEELGIKINTEFESVRRLLSSSKDPMEFKVNGATFMADYYDVLVVLKQRAYDIAFESNRQKAINDFMAKVENLTSQLEELQSQIQS